MNDFAVFNVFNVIRSFISGCHLSFSDACGCSVVVFMLSWKMMKVNMVLSTFSVRKISSVSLAAVSNPLFYTIADYIMESLLITSWNPCCICGCVLYTATLIW